MSADAANVIIGVLLELGGVGPQPPAGPGADHALPHAPHCALRDSVAPLGSPFSLEQPCEGSRGAAGGGSGCCHSSHPSRMRAARARSEAASLGQPTGTCAAFLHAVPAVAAPFVVRRGLSPQQLRSLLHRHGERRDIALDVGGSTVSKVIIWQGALFVGSPRSAQAESAVGHAPSRLRSPAVQVIVLFDSSTSTGAQHIL